MEPSELRALLSREACGLLRYDLPDGGVEFPVVGDEPVTGEMVRAFRSGELLRRWAADHPEVFEAGDLRVAMNQRTIHWFHEWYAAVLLKGRGWLSLVDKYGHHGHLRYPKRQDVLSRCLSRSQHQYLITRPRDLGHQGGWPDLFVYRPDFTACFLCEVKGPEDDLRETQARCFAKLREETGLPVGIFQFHQARESILASP